MVVAMGGKAPDDFVDSCFNSTENCGSGHPLNTTGWIFDFVRSGTDVAQSSAPLTYVAWVDKTTNRRFYTMRGLAKARYTDAGVLVPYFGEWTYEVLDEGLFDKIARK